MPVLPVPRPKTLSCSALVLLLTAASSSSTIAQELPTPEEIITRYVEASGGEDAMRAHTSMTSKGTFEWPAMGVKGESTLYAMAPDKFLSRLVVPGLGEIVQAYDGEIGWTEDPDGVSLLDGEMLADLKRQTRFYAALEYANLYPKQKTVGETEWNGQIAYRVDLVDTDGGEHSHYFSSDTGLLIGTETTITSDVGTPMKATTHHSDHKDFGGVVIATSGAMKSMGMEMLQTVDTVTWDKVSTSVFELPDAVTSLLPE
ncbi:MAG: hypothetical protein F4060_09175 [Holophagales bacterium]|nr:hypothetical protein [Holophagales bacterium]MYG29379.1 hypothetical protein [Holophagales bacterium]MYI80103.1 hypothetical protein [Holophagales bacterium]